MLREQTIIVTFAVGITLAFGSVGAASETSSRAASWPPVIVRVDNTAGTVGGPDVLARLYFDDADCDVVGGTWSGSDGSSRDFGNGARNTALPGAVPYECSSGHGSFTPFTVTCSAPGQPAGEWIEYVAIRDAKGDVSQRFSFTHSCSTSPTSNPQPSPVEPVSYSEQASIHHVVHTFANYHNASAQGPDIAAGQVVQVSCKVLDGTITSVNPDGYWYRIASAPWNNGYYAPANTFLNGDPPNGPYSKNTDFAVPDCSSSVGGPPKPPAVPKPGGLTCPGYYVVGTRGSGDKLSQAEGLGAPGLAFKNALFNDLHEPNMQVVANPYPAAAVLWFATGGGGTKLWFDGVDTGESWLTAKIKALVVQCPSARLYLTGYSQGAEVVGDVYSVLGSALRAHVGGVVLFGDPRLNKSSFALSVTGLQRSRKTLTNNGALSMRGEFPSDARGRIISYCHGTDPVCQGLKQLVHDPLAQDHKNYNAEPGDAAAYFAAHR